MAAILINLAGKTAYARASGRSAAAKLSKSSRPLFFDYQVQPQLAFTYYGDSTTGTKKKLNRKFLLINTLINTNPSFTEAIPNDSVLATYNKRKLILEKDPLQLYSLY